MKTKSKFWFLSIIILVLFSGCAVKVPITKTIIREVGGINSTEQFQYYISKTITLTLVAENRSTQIKDGQLVRKRSTAREKITIMGNLPGIVRKSNIRENHDGYILDVAFEEYDGDPVLKFGQYHYGVEEKYFLLYGDSENRIVKYGNDTYRISYSGDDAPYLIIKMKSSYTKSAKSRKAKGVKL